MVAAAAEDEASAAGLEVEALVGASALKCLRLTTLTPALTLPIWEGRMKIGRRVKQLRIKDIPNCILNMWNN